MRSLRGAKKSSFPALLHLSYVLQHLSNQILEEETGVGLSAARIMSVLDKSAAVSQRDVAMELKQTEANVSRQLQSMHKLGLVNINKSKKDSRQREVTLTAKGLRHYQQAEKLLKKQQAKVLKMLSAGEAQLLDKVAEKIS